MELPWNICPYCGTPAAGMRRDASTSVDEALRGLKLNDQRSTPQSGGADEPDQVKVEE
jgi:hypothetical protein